MSIKHKNVFRVLNYIDHSLIVIFYSYRMCFYFSFCFFSWYYNRNYEFCNWIKICVITAGIKKYNNEEKEEKHDKKVLLAKFKLNSV